MYKFIQLLADGATDFERDGNRGFVDAARSKVHGIAGWDPNRTPITNNEHYTYNLDGTNKIKLPDAPFGDRHEFPCVKGLGTDIAAVWGGDNTTPDFESVWAFTQNEEWVQKTANWGVPTSAANSGKRYGQYYCKHVDSNNVEWLYTAGGALHGYLTGGVVAEQNVYRSNDYVTWTKVCDLPPGIEVGMVGCMESFLGKLWLFGGGYANPVPHVVYQNFYVSEDDGLTWQLHSTRPDVLSAPLWANSCTTEDTLFVLAGTNSAGGIEQGMWYTHDMINWHQVGYNIKGRHATAVFPARDGKGSAYVICGNFWNDMYIIKKV